MSAAAQAVRPKPASPETKRRPVQPTRAMLAGSPRYLRSSVRLGGLHDPQEHEAERAASTISSGGCHQVHDPGGSGHLRATGAEMTRAEPGAVRPMTPVTRPGTEGGVRRAAAHEASDPGGAQHLRATPAHRVIDPGAEGQVRRSPAHAGDGPPVRAMHTTAGADKGQHSQPGVAHAVVDAGGAASLRATPALWRHRPWRFGSDPPFARARRQ